MKTKLNFTILLALFCLNINAQTPNWQWVNETGGSGGGAGNSVCTDINGNVLVTGYFSSPSVTFGTDTLINGGTFVVKYDPSGNVLWAKSANGGSQSISTDASGNVFVTGSFSGPSIIFGTDTLISAGGGDVFVAKYDAAGNAVWAKLAGGTFDDSGNGISIDIGGNVLVTGYFDSPSIIFGTNTFSNADITGNTHDFFVVKYDASGNVLWANSSGYGYGQSISTDVSGNVFITGYFANGFAMKYDAAGNVLWTNSAGGSPFGRGISTDATGNVFVTGSFSTPSVIFGTYTLNNHAGGGMDIFVVKYDAAGNVLWAKSAGGIYDDHANGIATDGGGNVFVTGTFFSFSMYFGTDTLNNFNSYYDDIFVVKYDTAGNVLWTKSAAGTSDGNGIATDASGNVFVTGYFTSVYITFGTTTLTNSNSTGPTGYPIDFFIAKLGSKKTGIEENYIANNSSVYPNPFSTQTTFHSDIFLKNATLTVYDSFGQAVKEIKNISGQTITLQRDNLSSGLYLIRIIQESKTLASDKLVITD